MFRAMVYKEFREVIGIALLALAAFGLLVTNAENGLLHGHRAESMPIAPFVEDPFMGFFAVISGAMAIGLGLRQTLGESMRGTYPFLFHRPVSRRWLVGMKLITGAIVYLLCAAVPILAYGVWAATPGTLASPFQWSMTLTCWEIWFGMILVYLGAFLSGIRPGRWFGSRLLPLVATGAALLLAVSRMNSLPWLLVVLVAADAILITSILFVAHTRDF